MADAVSGRFAVAREERWRRKNGTEIDVTIWNAQLRDGSGRITGVVEAVADNTEGKRLEQQFRQAQKMEAVGRLAGGVAHDFNNLLTVITGYCQMLLEDAPPQGPLEGDLKQVLKAADRATALTKQLLAFSRKQIVQPRVVDLYQLIRDMDHLLKRLIGETVDMEIVRPGEVYKVRVDPKSY